MKKKDISNYVIFIDTKYGRKKFVFNMNRHYEGNDKIVMDTIARWIVNNVDSEGWFDGPLWFIPMMLNRRIAHITPGM